VYTDLANQKSQSCQILILRSDLGSLRQAFQGRRVLASLNIAPVIVNAPVQHCARGLSLRETTLGNTFLRQIGLALHAGFPRTARISASARGKWTPDSTLQGASNCKRRSPTSGTSDVEKLPGSGQNLDSIARSASRCAGVPFGLSRKILGTVTLYYSENMLKKRAGAA